MKNILALVLFLIATPSFAIGVYKPPSVVITYSENDNLQLYAPTTMIRTTVSPYILHINIKNNSIPQTWNVTINEGAGPVSTHFIPDNGCDRLVARGETCIVNVQYIPDYINQNVTDKFTLQRMGGGVFFEWQWYINGQTQ